MPTEMRAVREVATTERSRTSGFGRLAAALALLAVSILAWPTIVSAAPGPRVGGDGLATTVPTVARERSSALPSKVPPGERFTDGQNVISVGEPWLRGSPDASTSQGVPFALGALVLIFVLAQWLIDRRDPKFVEAPAKRHEDSIGFE
jgi:hypothetical protein